MVDFTGHGAQDWVLANDAATPYPDGDDTIAAIPQLMKFTVGTTIGSPPDRSSVPPVIVETNNLAPLALRLVTARLRTVQAGESSPGVAQLGDAVALRDFTDAATETPQLGSTEAWAMRNHSPDTHPIHMHMAELRLVGRWHVGQWDADGRPVPSSIGPFDPPVRSNQDRRTPSSRRGTRSPSGWAPTPSLERRSGTATFSRTKTQRSK